MRTLKDMGIEVQIWTMPQEVADPIPFEQDEQHASYDADCAQQFWPLLVQADRLLTIFRARYAGKCSPVHFFWGSFDLAASTQFIIAATRHRLDTRIGAGIWVALQLERQSRCDRPSSPELQRSQRQT